MAPPFPELFDLLVKSELGSFECDSSCIARLLRFARPNASQVEEKVLDWEDDEGPASEQGVRADGEGFIDCACDCVVQGFEAICGERKRRLLQVSPSHCSQT